MYLIQNDLNPFLEKNTKLALVQIIAVHGSTPRNEDAWMLVSENDIFRTIGGGELENLAIDKARSLLNKEDKTALEMQVPLGPHTSQCCGGTVQIVISHVDEAALSWIKTSHENELEKLPHVYIFGAGHVGKAIGNALSLLPLKPILIDARKKELTSVANGIETRLLSMPEMAVRNAPSGSAFIILTHDHSLDFLIAQEALLRKDAAYVGMIGSRTKRAKFKNWLRRVNSDVHNIEKLVCPIGNTSVKDKRPEIIAAYATAEVITHLHNAKHQSDNIDAKERVGLRSL